MDKSDDLYEEALHKMNRENPDIQEVLDLLNKSFESGDPRSAYALGTWYLHGKYVGKNIAKAVNLLKFAAERNIPDACYDLAVCYERSVGVRKDTEKAFELYLRAVLYGDQNSVYEVGRCFYYGIGIEKNERIANIWLEKAEQINPDKYNADSK